MRTDPALRVTGELPPPRFPLAGAVVWRDKLLVKIETSWNENDIDELDRKGLVITAIVRLATFPGQHPGNEFFGHADRFRFKIASLDRSRKPGFKYSAI
jgi:hypothetical protein